MRVDGVGRKGVGARRMPNVTYEEKMILRDAFDKGLSTKEAGKLIGRSRYTACKYYAQFRGTPYREHQDRKRPSLVRPKKPDPKPKPLVNPSRFYTSDFVPS